MGLVPQEDPEAKATPTLLIGVQLFWATPAAHVVPRQQRPAGGVQAPGQVVNAPAQVPPKIEQTAWVTEVQPPVVVQHAPAGCGQLTEAQAELTPWNVPPCEEQAGEESPATHEPSGKQHAPSGQVLFTVHATPAMNEPPSCEHCVWVTDAHAPVFVQQAPLGSGHGVGEQEVPTPWKVPPAQVVLVVAVHAPVVLLQHAPVGWGQGLGEQTVLSPW